MNQNTAEQVVEQTDPVCPLLTAADGYTSKCLKERCAWWDASSRKCAILNLSLMYYLMR